MERPLCECHGEPMGWRKSKSYSVGGYWRCLTREREATARWREKNRDYWDRYFSSPAGWQARDHARWNQRTRRIAERQLNG